VNDDYALSRGCGILGAKAMFSQSYWGLRRVLSDFFIRSLRRERFVVIENE
jgi:hypothetical protein